VELRDAIADAIAKSHSDAVTFCGGEPLLVRGIVDYARRQRNAGKATVLNTNGELLVRRCGGLEQLPFSVVGVSIDGPDVSTHRAMRGSTADFDGSLAAVRWLRGRTDRPRLKLATVVSAVNADRIGCLAELVRELAPDVWRLYEYSSWGPQNHAQARHRLAPGDFDAVVRIATQHVGAVPVRASSSDTTAGCLIVDPLGRVLRPGLDGAEYTTVGNCLDESIDDIWSRLPDQSVIRSNKVWLRPIVEAQ
jgi:MoaA/NifB/PqqE/SkfB family radical SAM enzyme